MVYGLIFDKKYTNKYNHSKYNYRPTMSQNRSIPQYKTLDIIKFYTQVYEFVNKYLIFVFAAFLSIIVVGILWIWQPSTLQSISINNST